MSMPTRYIDPPMRRIQYIGRMAFTVSTKFGYVERAVTRRSALHMRPWVMPLTHIETT